MLLVILLIIVIIALFGGIGYGYPRYGALGYSPLVLTLLLAIIVIASGGLHFP